MRAAVWTKSREIQTWIGEYVLISSVWNNVRKTMKHLLSSSEHYCRHCGLATVMLVLSNVTVLWKVLVKKVLKKIQLGSTMGQQKQAQSQGLCSLVPVPQIEVTALQPL